jgi:hypothetical protein
MALRKIIDLRMKDGSRLFAGLPETYCVESPQWHALRRHIGKLAGACEVEFVTDDVTEAWIKLRFRRHVFQLNNQCGEWNLFVTDPTCPDDVLEAVRAHFAELTGDDG